MNLITPVVQAIPTYLMVTFKLKKGVCEDFDAIVRKFWWSTFRNKNRFLALKPWKDICKPKSARGLGFLHFSNFNLA